MPRFDIECTSSLLGWSHRELSAAPMRVERSGCRPLGSVVLYKTRPAAVTKCGGLYETVGSSTALLRVLGGEGGGFSLPLRAIYGLGPLFAPAGRTTHFYVGPTRCCEFLKDADLLHRPFWQAGDRQKISSEQDTPPNSRFPSVSIDGTLFGAVMQG